jgi:hypothetical protein
MASITFSLSMTYLAPAIINYVIRKYNLGPELQYDFYEIVRAGK